MTSKWFKRWNYHVFHLWGEIPLVATFSWNLIGRLLAQWREIERIIGSLSVKIRLDNFQAWKVVKIIRKERWRRPFEWTVHGHVIGHMTTSLIRIGTFFFRHILARRRDSIRGCLLSGCILTTLMAILRHLEVKIRKRATFRSKKYELQLLSGPLKLTQGGLIDKTDDGGGVQWCSYCKWAGFASENNYFASLV